MKAIVEPTGGTLLDNTMILYGSSLGDGNEHDKNHLPTLLAGGGGGTIRTGRLLEFDKPVNLANFHLSFLQRLGLDIDSFGTSDGVVEELAG
jgi:hypothetical protein